MTDPNNLTPPRKNIGARVLAGIGVATAIVIALGSFTSEGTKLIVGIKKSACEIGLRPSWCKDANNDEFDEIQKRAIEEATKALEEANSQ